MDIITIFNYTPDTRSYEQYEQLLKVWVHQAVKAKSFSEGSIRKVRIISHKDGMGTVSLRKSLLLVYGEENVELETYEDFPLPSDGSKPSRWWHLTGFKLHVICSQKRPFIFLDSDAIIVTPRKIGDVIKASCEKPFICVNHQKIPGHTDHVPFRFINSGFLVVSDPSFIGSYEEVIKTPITQDCPGTCDQEVIWNLFKDIKKYEYTHPLVHYGWNACSGFKRFVFSGGEFVRVFSDGTTIPEKHEIHVLHYWYDFKPWITRCEIYNYLSNEVQEHFKEKLSFKKIIEEPLVENVIVNCSLKDSSDRLHEFPLGTSWQFETLDRSFKTTYLSDPHLKLSKRKNLVFCAVNPSTDLYRRGDNPDHPQSRIKILKNLQRNGIYNQFDDFKDKHKTFLEEVANSAFVISPEGNGIDCHRHYEAWIVGAIPIVIQNDRLVSKYENLVRTINEEDISGKVFPIIWTNDYSEITETFLKEKLIFFEECDAHGKMVSSKYLNALKYPQEKQEAIRDMSNFWINKMT